MGRPEFLGSKHIDVVWEPILNQMIRMNDAPSCWKTCDLLDAIISIHGFPTSIRMQWLSHPKSALEPFQRLRESSRCVFSSDSSLLAYWNFRWFQNHIFCIRTQRHKRLLTGIQRTELFPLLSAQREGLRWLRLFDYTLYLISISRPFWEYDCLLEASGFLANNL